MIYGPEDPELRVSIGAGDAESGQPRPIRCPTGRAVKEFPSQ